MTHDTPSELQRARVIAMTKCPYYSRALGAVKFIEDSNTPSFSSNSFFEVHYNPSVVDSWPFEHLVFGLLHEIGHILRSHHARADTLAFSVGTVDTSLWNRACDFGINNALIELGLSHPDGIVCAPYQEKTEWGKEMTPEQIYMAETSGKENNDDNDNNTDDTDDNSDTGDTGNDGDSAGSNSPSDSDGDSDDSGNNRTSECGSCCTGGEEQQHGEGGMSQSERDNLVHYTALDTIEYEQSHPGSVPADMLRDAEMIVCAPLNYSAFLRRVITSAVSMKAGTYDYTYTRPRRRNANPAIILPHRVSPSPVRVLSIIDTSASMSDKQVGMILYQLKRILSALNVEIDVAFTDAHNEVEVIPLAQIKPHHIKGGGGTDMMGPLKTLVENTHPDCVFIFTDGWCYWEKENPVRVPVYGVIAGNPGFKPPKWLRVTHLT